MMAIFDTFNIRLPGEGGRRRPVSRAEAEDYVASLGLRPGGPGWGDAIRDYVLNPVVQSSHVASFAAAARPTSSISRPSRASRSSEPSEPSEPSESDLRLIDDLLPRSQQGRPISDGSIGGRFRESRNRSGAGAPRSNSSDTLNPQGERRQSILPERMREDVKRWIPIAERWNGENSKGKGNTAEGPFQIIDDTWVRYYPRLFGNAGETREQMLDVKKLGMFDGWVVDQVLEDNANHLHRNGFAINPTNLYLTHFAGWPAGIKTLQHPDWPVGRLLSNKAIRRNRIPENWTGASLVDWARRRIEEGAAQDK